MAEGVTQANVEHSLGPIHNRAWVVDQCLTALAADAHVQSCLLDYGLVETAAQLQNPQENTVGQGPKSGQGDGGAGQLEWRCKRLHLLQHRERLATLQQLSSGCVLPVQSDLKLKEGSCPEAVKYTDASPVAIAINSIHCRSIATANTSLQRLLP